MLAPPQASSLRSRAGGTGDWGAGTHPAGTGAGGGLSTQTSPDLLRPVRVLVPKARILEAPWLLIPSRPCAAATAKPLGPQGSMCHIHAGTR